MKIVFLITSIITGLLLLSTMICGLWIRGNKVQDIESLNFHTTIGIVSVIFGVLTVIIGIILVMKK